MDVFMRFLALRLDVAQIIAGLIGVRGTGERKDTCRLFRCLAGSVLRVSPHRRVRTVSL